MTTFLLVLVSYLLVGMTIYGLTQSPRMASRPLHVKVRVAVESASLWPIGVYCIIVERGVEEGGE